MTPPAAPGARAPALREALAALRGQRALAAAVLAGTLALAALEAGAVALIYPTLDALQQGGAQVARLRSLALLITAVVIARGLTGYAVQLAGVTLQARVLLALREAVVAALLRHPPHEAREQGDGRVVNLFTVQTEQVVGALSALQQALTAAALLGLYALALVLLDWRLALVALALAALGLLVARGVSGQVRARSHRVTAADEEATRLVMDDIAGLAVLAAHGARESRLARHRQAGEALLREAVGLHRWRAALAPLTESLLAVVMVAGLLLTLAMAPGVVLGNLPLWVTFAVVVRRLQTQAGALGDAWSDLAQHEGAAANLAGLTRRAAPPVGTLAAPPRPSGLTARGVTFAYRPAEPVLEGVDLDLVPGEVVALVGASGSGKSTLVSLLSGVRQPGGGRVLLDGVPLERVAPGSLARGLGVVFEGGFVFDESVLWNVTLGRQLREGDVETALRLTGAAALWRRWGERRLGPGGRLLSAGQRQRVALARALAAGPFLLLLDEATSALDAASERAVLAGLRDTAAGRITLVVAHRLSTVLAADRVALLDGGRVSAQGTHDALLDACPAYRRLVTGQLAGAGVS